MSAHHQSSGTDNVSSGSSIKDNPEVTKESEIQSSEGEGVSAGVSRKISEIAVPLDEFESFLERFWAEVGIFSFDKAKEIADREKERALKTHVQTTQGSSSGFTWVILTTTMAQIAGTEKQYVNLIFLAPKGLFIRQHSNLKTTLETIRYDLTKIAESSVTASPARHRDSKVASALLTLVNLRLDLVEFYEKLTVYGTAKNVEIDDLISEAELIQEKFNDKKASIGDSISILSGIINPLNWEVQIIVNLLKAISSMERWEYLESTMAIQEANSALQEWSDLIQTNSLSVKKSSFYSATPSYPSLYLWIKKLKGALVSKFTLYFYELLAQHSNPCYDMKTYSAKLPVDYYTRIATFQKKADALSICIVFDARGTNFHRNGYRFPGRPEEPLHGLDSFPAIMAVPSKPSALWPGVVMIINDKISELNADKFIGFFDSRVQVTYFIQKIDVRMYFLIIYEAKKSEKDSYTQKFMSELAADLKCGKIFTALRNAKQ